MQGLLGVQLKKSYTCRDSFMNVIIPHCSRLGQRAFAGCSLCRASGLLRPVTAGTLSSICKAGRALENRYSRLARGSRRLSAGTHQNSYRSQPSRRDYESKVKREVKKTVFSHGALQFYATCHPGLSHHQLHAWSSILHLALCLPPGCTHHNRSVSSVLRLESDAGLEQVTAKELGSPHIGAFDIQPGKAGVHFRQAPPCCSQL